MARKSVLQSFSIMPELLEKTKERSQKLGMSLSGYLQALIKNDLNKGGTLEVIPDEELDKTPSVKKSSK